MSLGQWTTLLWLQDSWCCSWGFVSLTYSGENSKESVLSREMKKTSELSRLERNTKLTNQICWLHVSLARHCAPCKSQSGKS